MTTIAIDSVAGPAPAKRGPAFGLALSLLVHAAVLAWLTHLPAPRTQDDAPVAPMRIWLAPARPARPAAPEVEAAPPAVPATHAAAPRVPARQRPPRARAHPSARASEPPAIMTAPPDNAEDRPAVPPAAGTDAAPVVDIAAARLAARRIAREDSHNLVTLPARKPVVDPNADHQIENPIERAHRGDCKTAYAGMGLLALIPLARDAVTGTGCKW